MKSSEFPTHVKTKAEAKALAQQISPNYYDALRAFVAAHPTIEFPRYQLDQEQAETLRNTFEWLATTRPKLYKRARWDLFYVLALRVIAAAEENGRGKLADSNDHYESARWALIHATHILQGDGAGI